MNKSSNALYTLFNAINYKITKQINKLSNRIKCDHLHYNNVYCKDTGLFMYKECDNCSKKRNY